MAVKRNTAVPGERKANPGVYALTTQQVLLGVHLGELGQRVEYEYQFLPDRKFRFDLYLPEHRIGIECNGGRYKFGHRSYRDTDKDNEKRNLAQVAGFKILEFTNERIDSGDAREFFRKLLEGK